jgi:ComF family protein
MFLIRNVTDIFYPRLCLCCKDQLPEKEQFTCLKCRYDLPLTNFTNQPDNLAEKLFYGRVLIEQATALFYFQKNGKIQKLIHQLKYNGQQQIGSFFGSWLAKEMITSNRFKNIDCIVSVPLHKSRFEKRGYNQLTAFGKTLSKELGIPYDEHALKRNTATKTQINMHKHERWDNVFNVFDNNKEDELSGKHVLLIDDIITTGSTIEACCHALKKSEKTSFSVASMAITV